jgi:hypothetical protein
VEADADELARLVGQVDAGAAVAAGELARYIATGGSDTWAGEATADHPQALSDSERGLNRT